MMVLWMGAAVLFALCVAAAALGVERMMRAAGRPTRLLWSAALAVAVVWPLLVPVLRPLLRVDEVLVPIVVSTDITTLSMVGVSQGSLWEAIASRVTAFVTPLHQLAIALWFLATVALFARLGLAAWRVHRLTRSAASVVVDGERVLLAEALGPASIGWRSPQIVLPAWVLALDGSLRALVLRHEREHCRAGDPRHVWSAAIAVALMPWNPAVWFMSRRLRLALELDCDARTLAQGGDPTVYAKLLLFMTQQHATVAAHHRVALSLAGSRSHLSRMIAAMKTSQSVLSTRARFAIGGAVVLAIGAACSTSIPGDVALPDDSESSAMASRVSPSVVEAPIANAPSVDSLAKREAKMLPGTNTMVYPSTLRTDGVEGIVLANYVVNPDGSVDTTTFKVLKSDHPLFVASVRNALPGLRYSPALLGGKSVRQLVEQPFVFQLTKGGSAAAAPEKSAVIAPTPAAHVPGTPYFEFQVEEPASMIPGGNRMQYPEMLRNAQVEGTVLASFVLSETSVPDMSTFKVLRSDHELFTNSVRTALPAIRYRPAKVGGQAVKQVVQQPFVFSLAR